MPKTKDSNPKEITITGIVEELALDDDDLALQIVDKAHTYRVVMDRQGRKLLDYVDEEIEATGTITKTRDASEIKIAHFHLLDEADEEEEDEEEEESWSDGDDDFMSERYDD